jgi:hypothetical protein
MSTLAFKVLLTPLLVGGVSLAGRRWGPTVSGLLIGLPLTSGPVTLFLALEQGTAFAAKASVGIVAGALSVGAFCLTYGLLALRFDWPVALVGGWLVFLALTWPLQLLALPLAALVVIVAVLLVLVVRLLPNKPTPALHAATPWWDIPARMLAATAVVLLLTGSAPALGPHLSGLLAPFPIYGTILAVFTHHFEGASAGIRLLRGLALGLFAFAAFFVVVALLLERAGILATFVAASVVALVIQAAFLWGAHAQS